MENAQSRPKFRNIPAPFVGECAEDYLCLSMIRALATREGLDLKNERYCEVGTYHAVAGSASYLLHVELGMTGVLVEANRTLVPDLINARPHDRVLSVAVVPDGHTEVSLFYGEELELSSLEAEALTRFHRVPVQPKGSYRISAIHFSRLMADQFPEKAPLLLSLGIEGLDCAVIEAYDFSVRPYIIQIKSSEDYDKQAFLRIAKTLEAHRYGIIQRTDVNQIAIDLDRFAPAVGLQSLPLGAVGLETVLDGVRVLSLDVFDTILARRCVAPTDVFRWMEVKHCLPGFADARVAAEKAARIAHRSRGKEVSLDEIYAELPKRFPASIKELELQSESLFLYCNPSILDLIARARRRGLRVIAVSDIYLSSEEVHALLRRAGVAVDEVYTSSELRRKDLGKYNARIYEHVLAKEGTRPDEVLHVGDNWRSDILNAQINGLRCMETKQLHLMALSYDSYIARLSGLTSTLAGSLVVGQLTQRKSKVASRMSDMEEFGYNFGGPMLAGFVTFLVREAREAGVERLLLLERDGNIVARALDLLKPAGILYRLMPASRRLAVFPLLARDGFKSLRCFFQPNELLTEADFFGRLQLTAPPEARQEGGRRQAPETIFKRHSKYLVATAERELAAIRAELAEEIGRVDSGARLAWVDVGWSLSSVSALNRTLGLDLACLCLGSTDRVAKDLSVKGYLFTGLAPEEVSTSVMKAVELLELLFTDTKRSTAYLKVGGDGVFPVFKEKNVAELTRDGYVREIGRGALAFVKDVADVLSGVDPEELRMFNQVVAVQVSSSPNAALYDKIARVPHDRYPGENKWDYIGDFWKPAVCEGGSALVLASALRSELQMLRRHPFRALRDLIIYRVLRRVARFSPPLPSKVASRFARSAAKRDPGR